MTLMIVGVEGLVARNRWDVNVSSPVDVQRCISSTLIWRDEIGREGIRNFVVEGPLMCTYLDLLRAAER